MTDWLNDYSAASHAVSLHPITAIHGFRAECMCGWRSVMDRRPKVVGNAVARHLLVPRHGIELVWNKQRDDDYWYRAECSCGWRATTEKLSEGADEDATVHSHEVLTLSWSS